MEFSTTERGARMLIQNGFWYAFQKTLPTNLQSWEWVLQHKGQCKAKVKLHMNGELVGEINEHTHLPLQDQIVVTKIKSINKTKVTNNTWHNPTNFGSCPSKYLETAAVNLLQINNLQHVIEGLPPEPSLLKMHRDNKSAS